MTCTRIHPKAHIRRPSIACMVRARFTAMIEIARQRRQLASLSDWQLKDIGLSRADVAREMEKPFWRV